MLDEKVCEKIKKMSKILKKTVQTVQNDEKTVQLYNCAVHGKIPKKAGKYSETANRWSPY